MATRAYIDADFSEIELRLGAAMANPHFYGYPAQAEGALVPKCRKCGNDSLIRRKSPRSGLSELWCRLCGEVHK